MKTRKYAIITGIIVLLMCLSGCKSNKYDKSGVKVVFELEGGTYQNSTLPVVYYYNFKTDKNYLITDPTSITEKAITRPNYDLEGWYTEKEYINKWNFETDRVSKEGITLYAKWKKKVSHTFNLCYKNTKGEIVTLGSYDASNGKTFPETWGYKSISKVKSPEYGYTAIAYVDENGDVQGYDIYFGKRLAKDLLGSEDDAEFTYVEAASRVEYLQSAKVDVILANFTVTDDRAEKVDFALPYMKVALGVVSPDDALIKDVKDLEGKKLIVVKGTTAETYFTDNYPDIELVKFDEYQEAYDALLDGRGDAFSTDNTEVLAWAQQNEGFSVGIESLGDIDTIAPAVQKGNTDLLNAINDEIKSLADEQFFHKDFEETLKPVYGDNINPDDLVVEGGVVDSEEKAEDADAAETEDSDAASDDTKEAETTEEPEETEAADAE